MKEKYNLFSSYNLMGAALLVVISSVLFYVVSNLDTLKMSGLAFYVWLNAQSPFLAGAIGIWVLGIVTFLARDIPNKVWAVVVKQTTVELTMNNIDDVYDHFLRWYHVSGRSAKARTLIAKNAEYSWVDKKSGEFHEMDISAGYGKHYFTFGGKMFQLHRELKEANQTTEVKESLTIKTIGRSQKQFHELLKVVTPPKDADYTIVYKWYEDYWKKCGEQAVRSFDSVVLPVDTKSKIVDHIDTFLNEREWYMNHGIPYRTGIILHGIPGTGKTSMVRALCDKFDKPLYVLRLCGISDDMLEAAFSELPKNSLVLIEDIDTYSVAGKRGDKIETDDQQSKVDQFVGLTLSGLLNAVDGIIASDGRILIATTNHVGKLDDALTRKGRFNLDIEIGYLEHGCILEFFSNFYPDFDVPDVQFKEEMTPAELQSVILENINNPGAVLEYCKS